MITRLRRAFARADARAAAAKERAADWRATLRRRTIVAATLFALWAGGIETRLVYLQVFESLRPGRAGRAPADADDHRAGRARRHPRPPRPRAGDERRRRLNLRRAVGNRGRARGRRGAVPRVHRLHAEGARVAGRSARTVARVRLGPPPGLARGRAPGRRARPRRAGLRQGKPALLPEQGSRRAPARLRRARQRRPERPRVGLRLADPRQARHGAHPDRRAAPRVQPGRAAADGGRERRADDRRVPAVQSPSASCTRASSTTTRRAAARSS